MLATCAHDMPPSADRNSQPYVLPPGATPASITFVFTGEMLTSWTSPPKGPSARHCANDAPVAATNTKIKVAKHFIIGPPAGDKNLLLLSRLTAPRRKNCSFGKRIIQDRWRNS